MRYKSCIWLNQGINFDLDSYKVCCLYSGKGGGNTIVKSGYKGEPIDWDEFFAYKRKIKEMHKLGKTYHKCEGCVFLEENDWDDSEDFINFINLDYWSKCESKCMYCHTMQDKEAYNSRVTYNFLPVLNDLLEKNLLRQNGHVSFGGGEVTLLPEFEEVLHKLLDFNIGFIRIHSGAIDYSKAIEKGLSLGNLDLIVSVDSGTKGMHRRIKQVDTYDKVWKNLKEYAKYQRIPTLVKTKYIVIPGVNDNKGEIEKWLKKSKSVGVKFVIQEIESQWFYRERDNVPKKIYELFDFAKEKARKMGLEYDLYERAAHMMNERKG